MAFTFTPPSINIDPTPFRAVGQTVQACNSSVKGIRHAQLAPYRIKTVCGQLNPEEKAAASELVKLLIADGSLTVEDRQWCRENGISLE